MKLLSNIELENHILALYNQLEPILKHSKSNVSFQENTLNDEGIFVYCNQQGYHYVYSERGQENTHKVTDDLFEISFWVLYPIVSSESFEFAERNPDDKKSYRQIAFQKQIEYLECLDNNYKKRGEIEIDEILKIYPY